eukprot:6188267-Pleurochrysis_carterae.AAC.2
MRKQRPPFACRLTLPVATLLAAPRQEALRDARSAGIAYLTAQVSMSSGSDHMRSQKEPSCGISCLRSISRIWSMVRTSGESPPCTHKTPPSTIAASGHLHARRTARQSVIPRPAQQSWIH